MPVILLCVIIFVVWLHYEISKSTKKDKEASNAFWEKESEANNTRKADLSDLNYIMIPMDKLPFHDAASEDITNLQEKIKDLSKQKIVNFTGLSNTDLKLKYGAPNLTILSTYDQNYTLLVRTLNSWASLLYDQNNLTDAMTILEFAVDCHSDIKNTYMLLGNIYKSMGDHTKIKELIGLADELNSLTKSGIIKELNTLLQ
ncbi:hypothetical protein EDD66_1188 [Mobilisporobacter senegalensis]|uniref:Tetratricopeptide repeat protein n=1 Tax=Mobilisporobacter senegalensis TaxID=1329262 RepID=A0A3N1X7I6_9FIRM|nr:hypothetical protein [Mobilisporobacter senegalensis]ROR21928.1 hypothetical protein EDD66_1188 [Mobilisporobacter senegalensis]